MNTQQIKTIEKEIGYIFEDKQLLIQAYTSRSFSNENQHELNYEILETIGDAVLSCLVLQGILKVYGKRTEKGLSCMDESKLTELRKGLVQNESLANAALEKNLVNLEYMRIGRGDKEQQVHNRPKVHADLLESIVGAVAVDCGFDNKTLLGISARLLDLDKYFETGLDGMQRNYIGDLQEYYQKRGPGLPEYDYEPDPNGEWVCRLEFDGKTFEETGHSKQEATNHVARVILETVENESDKLERTVPFARRVEQNPIGGLKELHDAGHIPETQYTESGNSMDGWSVSALCQGFVMQIATAPNKKTAKMLAAEKLYKLVKEQCGF